MRALLALPLALLLAGCDTPSASRRAEFAREEQVRSDVVAYVARQYRMSVPADAPTVKLGCTVMGSQCELVASIDAAHSGLPTHFLLWPRYRLADDGRFELLGMDDDLRPRLVRRVLRQWFAERLSTPDAPLATLRLNEFNGFVAIEAQLPTDLAALQALDGDALLERYGNGMGINLYVYVLAEPEAYAPKLRAGLKRLLAEPKVRALGDGLDIRWFFRNERPGVDGVDAEHIVRDGDNLWLPQSNRENTRAKWQLSLTGHRYGDDLEQPIEALWPRIDRQEPMLTQ